MADDLLSRRGRLLVDRFRDCAIFWAMGGTVHPFTVILYSLYPISFAFHAMAGRALRRPAPYDSLIFLTLPCVMMLPFIRSLSVFVWSFPQSDRRSLGQLIATGRNLLFRVTAVYEMINFLYSRTRARLDALDCRAAEHAPGGRRMFVIQDEIAAGRGRSRSRCCPKKISGAAWI